jgi:hypothetical protein
MEFPMVVGQDMFEKISILEDVEDENFLAIHR